jgi:hypothetical protein
MPKYIVSEKGYNILYLERREYILLSVDEVNGVEHLT